jgi:hypothetical protein
VLDLEADACILCARVMPSATSDLFESARHEPLATIAWDVDRGRATIETIVADTLAAADPVRGWLVHPLDDDPSGLPNPMLYFGAAGAVWALDHLAVVAGTSRGTIDWAALLASRADEAAAYAAQRTSAPGSLLMGATGVLLTEWRITRSRGSLDRIASCVEHTLEHRADDIVWGAPGVLLAAAWLHEQTGEERWGVFTERGARELIARMETCLTPPVRIWKQNLYGLGLRMLGAGHGLASNALSILRAEDRLDASIVEALKRDVVHTLVSTALVHDGRTNWPRMLRPVEPEKYTDELAPDRRLVQFCHGAPGIVISLAERLHGFDPRFDALMLAAGELTWDAGPLAKGAGICHGTAGNGYAFLALWQSTGDALWLERARAFAMHAITQYESSVREHGRGRWSLWTGDLGTACFLADCIRGRGSFPTLHEFFES